VEFYGRGVTGVVGRSVPPQLLRAPPELLQTGGVKVMARRGSCGTKDRIFLNSNFGPKLENGDNMQFFGNLRCGNIC